MAHYEAESLKKLLDSLGAYKAAVTDNGLASTESQTTQDTPIDKKQVVVIPPSVPLLKDMPKATKR